MNNEAHTLFCDESGNSGSKFYDLAQPFFAVGGWILQDSLIDASRSLILSEEKKHGYTPQTKGNSLNNSSRGLSYCRDIYHSLGQLGAIPYLYIAEKRYAVCAKIVETLLDPAYNPNIEPSETADPERRQTDAQCFYDGPEILIAEFATAYRNGDSKMITANAEKWMLYFLSLNSLLSQRLSGCLPTIEKDAREEFEAVTKGTPIGYDSLNMPCILRVLQHAENNIPFPCRLVHDKIATFEAVFTHVYNLYANAQRNILILKDGSPLTLGFRNLHSLEFRDSESEPILRAADYLASSSTKYANSAMADKPCSAELTECAFSALGGILVWALSTSILNEPCPKLGEAFVSNQFVRKVFGRLAGDLKDLKKRTTARHNTRNRFAPRKA